MTGLGDAAGALWFFGVIAALMVLFAGGIRLRIPAIGLARLLVRGAVVGAAIAVTIFANNRAQEPVGRIDASMPEDALITRPDLDVVVQHLPAGGAAFLTSLLAGQSLCAAAALAAESFPSFDLAANIAGMIQAGAFTTISLGEA